MADGNGVVGEDLVLAKRRARRRCFRDCPLTNAVEGSLAGDPVPITASDPKWPDLPHPNGAQTDISLQDVLDPAFGYQAGTLRVDNSVGSCAAAVCTPAEEAVLSATIDAGNQSVANARLDIAASRVWVLMFSVKMQ